DSVPTAGSPAPAGTHSLPGRHRWLPRPVGRGPDRRAVGRGPDPASHPGPRVQPGRPPTGSAAGRCSAPHPRLRAGRPVAGRDRLDRCL
ncbi:MAG: hypothetical protein AVDCRST_MAG52-3116, partial [uncultured Blastococcus sp.]